MLFLAAIKGNYFPVDSAGTRCGYEEPERGQIWENIVAALNSLQQPKFSLTTSQELFEIGIQV